MLKSVEIRDLKNKNRFLVVKNQIFFNLLIHCPDLSDDEKIFDIVGSAMLTFIKGVETPVGEYGIVKITKKESLGIVSEIMSAVLQIREYREELKNGD